MPELPEVEVVKRSLKSKIQNLVVKKVAIKENKLRYRIKLGEISKITGARIKSLRRRSKFLLFFFDKPFIMLVHLGMTGKFFFINNKNKRYKTSFYYNLNEKKDKRHDRVIFYLEKKNKLVYNDIRKFGFIKILSADKYLNNFHLKNLGPEPLTKNYNFIQFKKNISNSSRAIKNILMDQKFVSGIGNIYANEVLFISKVKPFKKGKNIKDFEIKKIISSTKKILNKAITNGGSSIRDFSSTDGKKGGFQEKLNVYGRKGKHCSNADCKQKIIKKNLSNRSTFYCPKCQQ